MQKNVVILQRICPGYRVSLFRRLSNSTTVNAKLYIGDDIPNSKVYSASNLMGINYERVKTRFIKLGRRILPLHVGLIKSLVRDNPDVIICEAESHFIGYLQAIYYKLVYKRSVKLIYWCFIGLPGGKKKKPLVASLLKNITRRFFSAFVVYSSFSRQQLLETYVRQEKIFVATNVGDTEKFISLSENFTDSKSDVKNKLGIRDQVVILYMGSLESNKKPELVLELALRLQGECYFIMLGSGVLLDDLRGKAKKDRINNILLPGKVSNGIERYMRAADALIVPGRGGIVISEAMSFGLPAIVCNADGCEYDLVKNGYNGYHLQDGDVNSFCSAIRELSENAALLDSMSKNAKDTIKNLYNTSKMQESILDAVDFAMKG
ncbi:MAG: glycosyltransferase family 4 protein [Coxiellaceae bacterium]|nr:glycosyltransferase family 4 protein [Coxiellaceae bacterium]